MPGWAPDAAKLAGQLSKMRAELDGPAMRKRLSATADYCAKVYVREAVIAELGDTSMSNWWHRKPIDVTAFSKELDNTAALVAPKGRALGPWRVLEDGRQGGAKRSISGFRTRITKTKGLRTYATKRRRNTGATAAKHTWSDAVKLMESKAPARLLKSELAAYRGIFRG